MKILIIRRYGDVCGSWKLISQDNIDVFLKAMGGMPEKMMKVEQVK